MRNSILTSPARKINFRPSTTNLRLRWAWSFQRTRRRSVCRWCWMSAWSSWRRGRRLTKVSLTKWSSWAMEAKTERSSARWNIAQNIPPASFALWSWWRTAERAVLSAWWVWSLQNWKICWKIFVPGNAKQSGAFPAFRRCRRGDEIRGLL